MRHMPYAAPDRRPAGSQPVVDGRFGSLSASSACDQLADQRASPGGHTSGQQRADDHLLTTAIWTNGEPLRDPMPKFHMTRADAEAVVAYLRSLAPGQ